MMYNNGTIKKNILNQGAICQKLLDNEIAILPTETVYGLAVRYDSQEGIDKIFELKKRNVNKPLSVHIHLSMLNDFIQDSPIKCLANRIFPGPFTLIIPFDKSLGFHSKDKFTGYVGLRVPSNNIFQETILKLGIPLCMTSANLTGQKTPNRFNEIPFPIDGIEDDKNISGNESMIIDASNNAMKVYRL